MVESKLVELVVAGSNPVGHPISFSSVSRQLPTACSALLFITLVCGEEIQNKTGGLLAQTAGNQTQFRRRQLNSQTHASGFLQRRFAFAENGKRKGTQENGFVSCIIRQHDWILAGHIPAEIFRQRFAQLIRREESCPVSSRHCLESGWLSVQNESRATRS